MLLNKIISEVTSVLFLLSSLEDPENEFSEEQPPFLVKLVGTTPLIFGDTYKLIQTNKKSLYTTLKINITN